MGDALDSAFRVLREAKEPLHYRDIAKRAISKGYWQTAGKTPDATINAQISVHLQKHGAQSRFRRTGPGTYALANGAAQPATPPTAGGNGKAPGAANQRVNVSFTDAAERVLSRSTDRQPRRLPHAAPHIGRVLVSWTVNHPVRRRS